MHWRAWLPREHALWGWVLVPLVAAVALAPGWVAVAGAVATVAGFAAINAVACRLRGAERAAAAVPLPLAIAAAAALAVGWGSPAPAWLLVPAALPVAGAGFVFRVGGRFPRDQRLEAGAIVALAANGGALAAAAGAEWQLAVCGAAALATWSLAGLVTVNRWLAMLLPGRRPWAAGWAWLATAGGGTVLACAALGHPWVGLLPAAYPLRWAVFPAPTHVRQLPRVGLTELGLGVCAAAAMAALG